MHASLMPIITRGSRLEIEEASDERSSQLDIFTKRYDTVPVKASVLLPCSSIRRQSIFLCQRNELILILKNLLRSDKRFDQQCEQRVSTAFKAH